MTFWPATTSYARRKAVWEMGLRNSLDSFGSYDMGWVRFVLRFVLLSCFSYNW